MTDFKEGDLIWMISFETENDFYLLSKQTIIAVHDDHLECEDDFNNFHVDFEDTYPTKDEAIRAMITRLEQIRQKGETIND